VVENRFKRVFAISSNWLFSGVFASFRVENRASRSPSRPLLINMHHGAQPACQPWVSTLTKETGGGVAARDRRIDHVCGGGRYRGGGRDGDVWRGR
jgi:hypothetical protein